MDDRVNDSEELETLLKRVKTAGPGHPGSAFSPVFEELDGSASALEGELKRPRPELLRGVHLKVRAELGRAMIPLKEALQLSHGSIVDLQKLADDPVDLYVNDLLIARGEVIVVNDCFCIRVTEVFAQESVEEAAHEL